jgi:CheY-like chemotaxis protein
MQKYPVYFEVTEGPQRERGKSRMKDENKKKGILIVDDDTTLREAISFDFKRRGFNVFSATNGVEGFEIVKKEVIDAVITDVRMPKGTGIELLDNIKAFNLRIPVVIFITGFTDLAIEDAYDKGACVVMSKPFDRKVLIANVQRALLSTTEKYSTPESEIPLSLSVELKFSDSMDAVQAKALSIGQGGMCIVCNVEREKVGVPLNFKIEHPGYGLSNLSGRGVVRWCRELSGPDVGKKHLGIEIIFLDEACRKNVTDFLEGLQVKAFIPKAT